MGQVRAEACPTLDKQWFALLVKPLHEKTVAGQLMARGLEAYAPVYTVARQWSDRVKMIEHPLFPWYVFCRFGFEDRLKVLGTPRVNSIVGFGGTPIPVRNEEMAEIRRILASGLPVTPHPAVAVGDRVTILGGPLAGLTGILARKKTNCRVIVNVETIHRAVAVEVSDNLIEAHVSAQS